MKFFLFALVLLGSFSTSCSKKKSDSSEVTTATVETEEQVDEESAEYDIPSAPVAAVSTAKETTEEEAIEEAPTPFPVNIKLNRALISPITLSLNGAEELTIAAGLQEASFTSKHLLGDDISLSIVQQPTNPALTCTAPTGQIIFAGDPLELNCPSPSSIVVETGASTYKENLQYSLFAIILYDNGESRLMSDGCSWQSMDSSLAEISGSTFLTKSAGTVEIRGNCDSTDVSTLIQIESANITSISVVPSTSSLVVGESKSLQVLALFDDNSIVDISNEAVFTSSNSSVIDSTGLDGIRGLGAGSAQITVSFSGQSSTHDSTVREASLNSLELSPPLWTGAQGISKQFYATGIYDDDSHSDVTNAVTWSSSNLSVATINASGLVSLVGGGTATITAEYLGQTQSVQVVSESDPIQSVTISPDVAVIPNHFDVKMTATALFASGESLDITDQVYWSVSNSSIASVSNLSGQEGLLSTSTPGSVIVKASYQGTDYEKSFDVQDLNLDSISISPDGYLLAKGSDLQYTARANYSNGSSFDITDQSVWSENHGELSISNAINQKGLLENNFTGNAAETVTVSVSFSTVQASSNLILTPNALISLSITPDQGNIKNGESYQLKAYGAFDDGGAIDLSSYVTWSSSDGSLLDVSNAVENPGTVTALQSGTTVITAKYSGLTATASITSSDNASDLFVNGVGLKGEYFSGQTHDVANFKGSRIDAQVLFNWDRGLAPLGVGDNFSVRWTGSIRPKSTESYTFWMRSDDGIRLWVDDQLIVDNWTLHAPRWDVASVNLDLVEGQQYSIKIEFFENGGHAVAELHWETPTIALEAVEQIYLYPPE